MRLQAGLLGRKSGLGFYDYTQKPSDTATASIQATQSIGHVFVNRHPEYGVSDTVATLIPETHRALSADTADVILVAPVGDDLSTTIVKHGLDKTKTVAVDGIFGSAKGITLMACPTTSATALNAARHAFISSTPVYVTPDSAGFVAPRIVACIINLACEMAQQGIATPHEIDLAVKLGLGYPKGPFEWCDELGAGQILQIVEGLFASFNDPRYRPAPWLRRRAALGVSAALADPVSC